MDPATGVYNAELVIKMDQLSPGLQNKLANLSPVVGYFQINGGAASTTMGTVTLNNSVLASIPVQYMASESPNFKGAAWQAYSKAPSFTLSSTPGVKTVYFQVMDGSGTQSAVASSKIRLSAAH
jgi:hypothetical protein